MNKKKVVMVMPHMVGGGAERVAAQIMNKLNERGYDTRFILTSAKKNEVVRSDLNEKTQLIILTEEIKAETAGQKLAHLPTRAYSTFFGKLMRGAATGRPRSSRRSKRRTNSGSPTTPSLWRSKKRIMAPGRTNGSPTSATMSRQRWRSGRGNFRTRSGSRNICSSSSRGSGRS